MLRTISETKSIRPQIATLILQSQEVPRSDCDTWAHTSCDGLSGAATCRHASALNQTARGLFGLFLRYRGAIRVSHVLQPQVDDNRWHYASFSAPHTMACHGSLRVRKPAQTSTSVAERQAMVGLLVFHQHAEARRNNLGLVNEDFLLSHSDP